MGSIDKGKQTKKSSDSWLFIEKLIIASLFFVLPNVLYASFFSSFINNFISRSLSIFEETQENVRNMALLQGALNPDFNPASGGGDILIVGGSALLPETGPNSNDVTKNQPSSDQISLYVVREGDSLSEIAEMFNVSVNTIIWGNNLRGTVISPGQTLVILPISGVRHTVKEGDTLAKIVKLYKGDLDEIVQYNDLAPDAKLAVGTVVIIPDGEIQATVSSGGTVANSPYYYGYYLRPVSGPKTQGIHGYNGVDLASPFGTPIAAAASGVVIISKSGGWNGGYGNYIVISHNNGTQTLYSHNSRNIVSVGDIVSQGQIIGYVGSTGRSTGAHVHFEVRGARNPF